MLQAVRSLPVTLGTVPCCLAAEVSTNSVQGDCPREFRLQAQFALRPEGPRRRWRPHAWQRERLEGGPQTWGTTER